jgi:hypothetical protein
MGVFEMLHMLLWSLCVSMAQDYEDVWGSGGVASELHGDESLASRSGRFTPGKKRPEDVTNVAPAYIPTAVTSLLLSRL